MEFPEPIAHVFGDCDTTRIDPYEHAPFILERLMARVEHAVVVWLRETYPAEALLAYLNTHGAAKLGPSDLQYWCVALGVEDSVREKWCAAAFSRVRLAPVCEPS
jgi:hypothetical protein